MVAVAFRSSNFEDVLQAGVKQYWESGRSAHDVIVGDPIYITVTVGGTKNEVYGRDERMVLCGTVSHIETTAPAKDWESGRTYHSDRYHFTDVTFKGIKDLPTDVHSAINRNCPSGHVYVTDAHPVKRTAIVNRRRVAQKPVKMTCANAGKTASGRCLHCFEAH